MAVDDRGQLLTTERLLDGIIEQNPYAMWLSDEDGAMVRANGACRSLFGFSDLAARAEYNLFTDDVIVAHGHMPAVRAVFSQGRTARFELEYDTAALGPGAASSQGRTRLDTTVAPITNGGGRVAHAVVMHRDVTEDRRVERELQTAKEYAERLIASANALIVVVDGERRLTVFNPLAEEVTGYTHAELAEGDWLEVLVPEARYPEFRARIERLASGEVPAQVEGPLLTRGGDERLIAWRNSPLSAGGAIAFGVDVTERRALEERLQHSQRLEAVGQLAGGIAHDFNNMLGVILGYAELLRLHLPPDDDGVEFVDEIQRAGLRSRDITRQLLAYSRRQIIAPQVVDLNTLVSESGASLIQLVGEDIELRVVASDALWPVRVDPAQFDQVLMNLVLNARDAMPRGGHLLVETANVSLDEAYCALHPDSAAGSYVRLAVSDDGEGMDAVTREHIFEPFFTTKPVGEGTGLGLATVYGIVRQNGGFINVYSEPARGTTFKVYLPRADGAVAPREAAAPRLGARGDFTILLVEDDRMVRRVTEAALRELGYAVLTADDAAHALALAASDDAVIDVLLTDVVMPRMSGPELHARMLALRPGVAAIYMSGYTENVIVNHGVLRDEVTFLQKPFALSELDAVLHTALGH